MNDILGDSGLDLLFRQARSFSHWQEKPVSEITLEALYDLLRMGPTSANCSPARFVFLTTNDAKNRIIPGLMEGNVEKVRSAPVTVIIASDSEFDEKLPKLFPHNPGVKDWFKDKELAKETAFRNSTLQGAYLIMAARALGLDCGPMSGFDAAAVDAEFFPEGKIHANFICTLGYGDKTGLHDRLPRLSFEEACELL